MRAFLDPRNLTVGASQAATWAWGVSLLVGLEIFESFGWQAFILWGLANSLTIPIFGWVLAKLPHIFDLIRSRLSRSVLMAFQFFAIWVQLTAIKYAYEIVGFTAEPGSTLATLAAGAVFVGIVYRGGLRLSMLTDVGQFAVMVSGLLVIIAVTVYRGATLQLPQTETGDIPWILYLSLLLIGGIYALLPHYQRARYAFTEGLEPSFAIGGILFGGYLAIEFIAWMLGGDAGASWVLLFVVFAVATSTLDSSAVAFHEAGGRRLGTIFALLVVLAWPLVGHIGLLGLFATYSSGMSILALIYIGVGLYRRLQDPGYTPVQAAAKHARV